METNFSKSHEEMQLERIILADNDLPTAKADCVISDLADQLTALNEKYANCVRQLTEAHARIDRFEAEPKGWWHKEVEELKQQLADTQKREVMMRGYLEKIAFSRVGKHKNLAQELFDREDWAVKALAATADLDKYVLCEKEPIGSMTICGKYEPLYRAAKEQEK